MTDEPDRCYGTDSTDEFETLAEVTLREDGTEHLEVVLLDKRGSGDRPCGRSIPREGWLMDAETSTTCPGCGEEMVGFSLTDSFLHGRGVEYAMVYGEGGGSALVYASRDGRFVHLHSVAIGDRDALTVRGSLRRWTSNLRRRLRWWTAYKVGLYRGKAV